MSFVTVNRRDVSVSLLAAGLGVAEAARAAPSATPSDDSAEISHSRASIHQEVVFAAGTARIYQLLTVAEEFAKVERLSGTMRASTKLAMGSQPTQIDPRPGGAFVFFGGYTTGCNLELVPNTRLVQAWRAGSWEPGVFSIARFELASSDAGTRLLFDHVGFPDAAADHLAEGWHLNYWEPMARVLG
jgi:uncharacterized protein YndB with AHSA1/START domain